MQLIAFTSFKGGCGKTTTLMAMAAMLAARGRRIALFEAARQAGFTQGQLEAEAARQRKMKDNSRKVSFKLS